MIAFMRKLFVILMVFVMACGGTALAKKKKARNEDTGDGRFPITEVDVLSVTVSVAKDGNVHKTYRITGNTTVTIDGVPVSARDLRAGMVASIDVAEDKTTALSINAGDPMKDRHKR